MQLHIGVGANSGLDNLGNLRRFRQYHGMKPGFRPNVGITAREME
jgi:hypothetical protein